MKNILLILTFALVLPLTAQPIDGSGLEKAMLGFDRAFIPVWYSIQHEQLEEAAQRMVFLKQEWQYLYSNYANYNSNDPDWGEAFRQTEVWLDGAEQAMKENCQTWAYNQLDHARYELATLRKQNRIHYQLDVFYDFEIIMSEVLEVVNDQMLCLLEWSELEFLVMQMEAKWMWVDDNSWDLAFFDIDANEELLLNEARRKLGFALKVFVQTVDTGQQCTSAEAAAELEFAYWRLLIRFGDFEGKTKVNILN